LEDLKISVGFTAEDQCYVQLAGEATRFTYRSRPPSLLNFGRKLGSQLPTAKRVAASWGLHPADARHLEIKGSRAVSLFADDSEGPLPLFDSSSRAISLQSNGSLEVNPNKNTDPTGLYCYYGDTIVAFYIRPVLQLQ